MKVQIPQTFRELCTPPGSESTRECAASPQHQLVEASHPTAAGSRPPLSPSKAGSMQAGHGLCSATPSMLTEAGLAGSLRAPPFHLATASSPVMSPSRAVRHLPSLLATPPGMPVHVPAPGGSVLGSRVQTPASLSAEASGRAGVRESDSIKVAVRIRPLLEREPGGADSSSSCVHVAADKSSLQVVMPTASGSQTQREFQFHACLGPDSSQADVMELCGIYRLLDAVLQGYNATIIAYGQTGSGKTFSMSGPEDPPAPPPAGSSGDDAVAPPPPEAAELRETRGIIARSVQYMLEMMRRRSSLSQYTLSATYLEIYNEGIYDLLNFQKTKQLGIRWDARQAYYVPGLSSCPCSSMQDLMQVMARGRENRRVGSHELNMESSRSHCILTLQCQPNADASGRAGPNLGKVSFVDLAGSERLKDSKSQGDMVKETTNINRSLFTLGKVISALAERDASPAAECGGGAAAAQHIPYRDSKLTKLLMDSLGGTALSLIIATCSPAAMHVEETLSTLMYATRAKNIRNRPSVRYDPQQGELASLRREVELLRSENALLREQMSWVHGMASPLAMATPAMPQGDELLQLRTHRSMQDMALHPLADGSCRSSSSGGGLPGRAGWFIQGPGGTQIHRLPSMDGRAVQLPSLQQQQQPAPGGGGGSPPRSGAAALAPARPAPEPARMEDESSALLARLQDTQNLLAMFSEESSRLAQENGRLQALPQMAMAPEVLQREIQKLRAKLTRLESSVSLKSDAQAAALSPHSSPSPSGSDAKPAPTAAAAAGIAPPSGGSSPDTSSARQPTDDGSRRRSGGDGGDGGGSRLACSPLSRPRHSSLGRDLTAGARDSTRAASRRQLPGRAATAAAAAPSPSRSAPVDRGLAPLRRRDLASDGGGSRNVVVVADAAKLQLLLRRDNSCGDGLPLSGCSASAGPT